MTVTLTQPPTPHAPTYIAKMALDKAHKIPPPYQLRLVNQWVYSLAAIDNDNWRRTYPGCKEDIYSQTMASLGKNRPEHGQLLILLLLVFWK